MSRFIASIIICTILLSSSTYSVSASTSTYATDTSTITTMSTDTTDTSTITTTSADAASVQITSPSAILMEASTGRVIYEKNAHEALAPASITKIMTLLLTFEALDAGQISLTDEVVVSEHAASMGGSQVYLEAGEVQTVDTMIKCIAVASANDACVAMAEYVAGTEELFVGMMNDKASALGMEQTHFVNSCGLDADGHVSSANDIAIMSRELINNHPEIYNYSTIWMDTITHVTGRGSSEFGLTNTNKLIKQYTYATGLKTGSTSGAGCCLSATANKDGIELIAVIMTAPNSSTRFTDAITLLNYGFGMCKIYKDDHDGEEDILPDITVRGGKKDTVSISYTSSFSYMFLENFDTQDIEKIIIMDDVIYAPIHDGDIVGNVTYTYAGETIGSVDIIATEAVNKATYLDILYELLLIFTV